jgi:hypothetical protein
MTLILDAVHRRAGVRRHAGGGYDIAIDCAREQRLDLPMIGRPRPLPNCPFTHKNSTFAQGVFFPPSFRSHKFAGFTGERKCELLARFLKVSAAAALMMTHVQASAADFGAGDTHYGAFAGARFRIALGGETRARPRAELAFAPIASRQSLDGSSRVKIGEGVALGFARNAKPQLTLAGVRADYALGLRPVGQVDAKNKLGLSTGAWVAIGVVAAIGVTAIVFVNYCQDKEASICGDKA